MQNVDGSWKSIGITDVSSFTAAFVFYGTIICEASEVFYESLGHGEVAWRGSAAMGAISFVL